MVVAIVLMCTDPEIQLKDQVQTEQQATCSAFEETSVFLSGCQPSYGSSSRNIFFSVLQCLLPTDTGLITTCKHTPWPKLQFRLYHEKKQPPCKTSLEHLKASQSIHIFQGLCIAVLSAIYLLLFSLFEFKGKHRRDLLQVFLCFGCYCFS